MRVYPETRLVNHGATVQDEPHNFRYARAEWDGESITVFTSYVEADARWLLQPYIIADLPADELFAHELRHIRQLRIEGQTKDTWIANVAMMEADAYAEIARYRERKSQGR
jgi:hypothetical protein